MRSAETTHRGGGPPNPRRGRRDGDRHRGPADRVESADPAGVVGDERRPVPGRADGAADPRGDRGARGARGRLRPGVGMAHEWRHPQHDGADGSVARQPQPGLRVRAARREPAGGGGHARDHRRRDVLRADSGGRCDRAAHGAQPRGQRRRPPRVRVLRALGGFVAMAGDVDEGRSLVARATEIVADYGFRWLQAGMAFISRRRSRSTPATSKQRSASTRRASPGSRRWARPAGPPR